VQEGYLKIFRKSEGVPLSQIANKSRLKARKCLRGLTIATFSSKNYLAWVPYVSFHNKVGQFGSAPSEIVRIVVEIIVAACFLELLHFFCSFC